MAGVPAGLEGGASALGQRQPSARNGTGPEGTGRDRARPARPGDTRPGWCDGVGWVAVLAVARPRSRRASCARTNWRRRARVAGARRIPRGGRNPRRGRSSGAAARPDVRPGAGSRPGAVLVTVEIEVVEDPARACGAMLVGASLGGGHVVLTGGSTPRAAYGELVEAVKNVGLDLSDTTYWLGDERCVPPDDE